MKTKITIILMIVAILFVSGHATTIAAQDHEMTWEERVEELNQQERQERQKRKQETAQRRQWYVKRHPDIDQYIREAILEGSIVMGMNKDEVVASWGDPYDKNRTVGSWGVHEQWIYKPHKYLGAPVYYFYFENGVLKSWQEY